MAAPWCHVYVMSCGALVWIGQVRLYSKCRDVLCNFPCTLAHIHTLKHTQVWLQPWPKLTSSGWENVWERQWPVLCSMCERGTWVTVCWIGFIGRNGWCCISLRLTGFRLRGALSFIDYRGWKIILNNLNQNAFTCHAVSFCFVFV